MLTNKKTYKGTNLRDHLKTFNDGVLWLYSANERKIEKCKGKFDFANESVGINHYWEAYNNNIGVDRALSVLDNGITIDPQDVVKVDDTFYQVVRIQYHDNKIPCYWTLTLAKSQFSYEVDL